MTDLYPFHDGMRHPTPEEIEAFDPARLARISIMRAVIAVIIISGLIALGSEPFDEPLFAIGNFVAAVP